MTARKDRYNIVILPGDGIGLEVARVARALLESLGSVTGVDFDIEEIPCSR